jgi:uncharacterized membrane protein YciS (DUF1049 family)
MEPRKKTFVNVALVISLILIIVDLIGKFANLTFTTWFKWLPSLILILALIVACTSFGKENNGNVTFGNVFGYGFKVTAIVTGIVLIYTIIALLFIFPETKDMALEQARKQMEEKGTMSQDNIDAALAMTRKLFMPFAIAGVIIGTLLIGAIGSVLGAAFTKKNKMQNSF